MRLTRYLAPDRVLLDPSRHDKAGTLDLLADLAVRRGLATSRDALLEAVLSREAIVTTGIGQGIAIPHADVPGVADPALLLGVFPEGVDFDSLDEEPVHLVFLLLGPPRKPEIHMRILARIARLSKNPRLLENLCASSTPEEVLSRLEEIEAAAGGKRP